ncbi:hypothetical protein B0H14DRAFT_3721850 [Mycena olivaceomarginata]|nr:hypothetical protein B0H14DRAFT_3721850 [Mycena olivaceomarginata]
MNSPGIPNEKDSVLQRATLTLNEFPMDTLIHIQSFMGPIDIIALRQCSKLMASATTHRTVWLDALRRVCTAHEVSVLTYPMENMSLRDLEHAATSPARFIAQISKEWAEGDVIPAFHTRLFQPRLPKSAPGNLGETALMRLVPGGRYLVTATDLARISVWDLGWRPAEVLNPYPLVSIVLPSPASQLLVQPAKDQRGFRLLSVCPLLTSNVADITVYEINPSEANPVLKQIAHRRIFSPHIEAFALTPDRFTYYYTFLLTAWDFIEDTSATVHVYRPLMSITVSRTAVIGQQEDGIVVVEMPPLQRRGTPAVEVVTDIVTPLPRFSHIHDVFSDFTGLYTIQADWHTSPDVPLVLDVFGVLVDGGNAYARCVVKQVPGGDPDLPSVLPVLMGISRVPPETFDAEYYGRLHFAGTHLVRTWPVETSVMINAARVPTRRQIELESKTAYLWEMPRDAEAFLYDLDSMSGRFVALAGPGTLRVLDYMLPHL